MSVFFYSKNKKMICKDTTSFIYFCDEFEIDEFNSEIERVLALKTIRNIGWNVDCQEEVMTDEVVFKLKEIITKNTFMKSMKLKGKYVKPVIEGVLPNLIQTNPYLEILDFDATNICNTAFDGLLNYIKDSHMLVHLEIHSLQFSESDFISLMDAIASNKSLTLLWIDVMEITTNGLCYLCTTLLSFPRQLRSIVSFRDFPVHCTKTLIDDLTNFDIRRLISKIGLNYRFQGPCNVSASNHIRCYSMSVVDLSQYLFDSQEMGKLENITTIFIYDTPLTYSFLCKWFVLTGVSQKVTMLALIKCSISEEIFSHYNEFFSNFPVLNKLNISDHKATEEQHKK